MKNEIYTDNFYRLDSMRVYHNNQHIVDDVKVIELPIKGAKKVLVYSPKLQQNVLVYRKDLRKLDWDDWFDKYKPMVNHLDPHASWGGEAGGTMYETYGAEEQFVREQVAVNPKKVWTLLDCDGKMICVSGWHYVNRFGYFVTEVECDNDNEFYSAED